MDNHNNVATTRHHLLSVSECENRHRWITTNAQVTNTKFVNFIKGRSLFMPFGKVFMNDIKMLAERKNKET